MRENTAVVKLENVRLGGRQPRTGRDGPRLGRCHSSRSLTKRTSLCSGTLSVDPSFVTNVTFTGPLCPPSLIRSTSPTTRPLRVTTSTVCPSNSRANSNCLKRFASTDSPSVASCLDNQLDRISSFSSPLPLLPSTCLRPSSSATWSTAAKARLTTAGSGTPSPCDDSRPWIRSRYCDELGSKKLSARDIARAFSDEKNRLSRRFSRSSALSRFRASSSASTLSSVVGVTRAFKCAFACLKKLPRLT